MELSWNTEKLLLEDEYQKKLGTTCLNITDVLFVEQEEWFRKLEQTWNEEWQCLELELSTAREETEEQAEAEAEAELWK